MPLAGNSRWIRKGRTQRERRLARRGIRLRSIGISQKTESRYLSAVARILPTLETCHDAQALDGLCEDWIECEWIKGTPLGVIGDALSGIHFFWPQAKGFLRGAWRLYRNWRKIEVPQRAPPLPISVCQALVGALLEVDQIQLAFLIGLGFHAYLRTGELLRLRFSDISATRAQGVVTIRASKSGLRFNIDEAVTILDPTLLQLWDILRQLQPSPSSLIWNRSATVFRRQFRAVLETLDVHPLGFQPYSLRRGGATFHFMRRCTMDSILLRGRWRSLNVGRLYLEDGMATLQQLNLSQRAKQLVRHFQVGLPSTFLH